MKILSDQNSMTNSIKSYLLKITTILPITVEIYFVECCNVSLSPLPSRIIFLYIDIFDIICILFIEFCLK